MRNAALAQNKKTWTLRHNPALHGYAVLDMSIKELHAAVLKDPFSRYYATAYLGTVGINDKAYEEYNNATSGQEIDDFADYLTMSEFFQTVLEPLAGVGVNLKAAPLTLE